MAHIILKRGGGWRDRLRSYRILVDGHEVERLRANAAAHVEVEEGPRQVQLTIDGCGSNRTTVLASGQCPAIFSCAAGHADARAIYAGRAARTAYLRLEATNAEDCARSYLRAASRAAAYATAQKAKIGTRSRFGLTDGDLSVLFHACRRPGSIVGTSAGSANHLLWSKLAEVGWMTPAPTPPGLPATFRQFLLTDYGRVELLDIF